MKRVLSLGLMALMASFAFVAPAEAQSFNRNTGFNNGYGYGYNNGFNNGYGFNGGGRFNGGININATQAQLQARIDAGIRTGRLSQREASRLQARLSQFASLEARLRASGNRLSFGERQRLANQLNNLSASITREMRDFDGRRAGMFNWFRGNTRIGGGGFWR